MQESRSYFSTIKSVLSGRNSNILGEKGGYKFSMGADGATSREGAAESRRRGRRAARRGTYSKYLALTCHKVPSASGNFVNVN